MLVDQKKEMNHNLEKRDARKAEQDTPELPCLNFDEKNKPQEDSPRSSSPPIVRPVGNCNDKENDVEAARVTTTASSITPAPVKVPRSKRRGLFGRFSILAEVEEPQHYSRRTKWYITFVIAMAAIAAPLGSAIILRASAQVL